MATAKQKVTYTYIEPEKLTLITDTSHPLYDVRAQGEPDESLVQNISTYGVLQPVIVVEEGTQFLVVDGRRRVLAALQLNAFLKEEGKPLIRIPYVVRESNAKDAMGVMISTNEMREEDSTLNKASKVQALIAYGYTVKQIATMFGLTEQAIYAYKNINELHPTVKHHIEMGNITATAALELAGKSEREQLTLLDELMADGKKITVARAKEAARTGTASTTTLKLRSRTEIVTVYENFDQIEIPEDSAKTYKDGYREALAWVVMQDEETIAALMEKEAKAKAKAEKKAAADEKKADRERIKALDAEKKQLKAKHKAPSAPPAPAVPPAPTMAPVPPTPPSPAAQPPKASKPKASVASKKVAKKDV